MSLRYLNPNQESFMAELGKMRSDYCLILTFYDNQDYDKRVKSFEKVLHLMYLMRSYIDAIENSIQNQSYDLCEVRKYSESFRVNLNKLLLVLSQEGLRLPPELINQTSKIEN